FYTPENENFYSQFSYMNLDPAGQEIRLLEEGPAQDDDEEMVLECTLHDQISLSSAGGTYCAISYCAGSLREVAPILVDRIRFNAFASLEHAIRCVLRQWSAKYPGRKLLIWADQICINQKNNEERTAQVGLMREIYRRSDETYVCLSNPSMKDCLRWIPSLPVEEINMRSTPNEHGGHPAVIKLQKSLRERILAIGEGEQALWRWLQSVQSFVNSPWWCRSWVYQEFIFSPRPFFLSGPDCVYSTALVPLVNFICEEIHPFLNAMLRDAVELRRMDTKAVTSILRSKEVLVKPADLQDVLQHSRNCHASDPRDRIYAFVGLAHREYGIVPDYDRRNTVCHALILAAQHIIRYEKGLSVLRYVHRGREKLGSMLPTWVPDWTSK
ncbi:hypothetical protein GQ53DRAFT_596140, partial [Thozetella sp. PMI_491]